MWLIIVSSVFALTGAGAAYLIAAVSRFEIIHSVAGDKKWLRLLISAAVVGGGFLTAVCSMNFVNAIVILLHVSVFFMLAWLFVRIAERISGRTLKADWQGWGAIGASVITLYAGYYLCNNVWKTEYNLETAKAGADVKIAMFADSHLGTTFGGGGLAVHLKEIERQEPDILLIPGDFVDDWSNREDLLAAAAALRNTHFRYGVWLSFGNHDEGFFHERDFNADELRAVLKENGVHILEDEYALIGNKFYVAGRKDGMLWKRKNMAELLEGADRSKYIIVMDHEPDDYANEAGTADLVVSGHTHGGQLLPIKYIARLFHIYDRAYGMETRQGTDFIVTSGISDWAIKFKTGTKSEYVIINVASPAVKK